MFDFISSRGQCPKSDVAERTTNRLTALCVHGKIFHAHDHNPASNALVIREGFQVVVLEDAIRAVDVKPGDGAQALEAMKAAGATFATLADL